MASRKIYLTDNQTSYLASLLDGPQTTIDIYNQFANFSRGTTDTKAMISSSMYRMEGRGLVRRASENPVKWELTKLGRTALR